MNAAIPPRTLKEVKKMTRKLIVSIVVLLAVSAAVYAGEGGADECLTLEGEGGAAILQDCRDSEASRGEGGA